MVAAFSIKTFFSQWSFGVLCWEVFSLGRTPYGGMSHVEVVRLLESGERLQKPYNKACNEEV